jgi:hypothetical protein
VQIESLEIKNCRLFRDAKLGPLPRMAIVAGANARASPRCLTTPLCPTGVDGVSAVRLAAGRAAYAVCRIPRRQTVRNGFSCCRGARWPISPSTCSVLCRRPGGRGLWILRLDNAR